MSNDDTQPQSEPSSEVPKNAKENTRTAIDSERIQELRDRLYSRGNVSTKNLRHEIPKRAIYDTMEQPVSKSVTAPVPTNPVLVSGAGSTTIPSSNPVSSEVSQDENAVLYSDHMSYSRKRKAFRKIIASIGVVFFIGALAVSAFLMFSGNNTISGDNISIDVSGGITVGGGEEFQFQVAIANQNAIPVQSATLIIEYPRGSHSIDEAEKEVSVERKQLDSIDKGELVNIPLKVRIFGEENEEKEIKVSVDYRVSGSNATFHKEATPLKFKVSTSPVVMTFDSVKSISSGQEMELKLTIQSNSPSPLTNLLVRAEYPEGFDFTESSPDTVSGEDTWKIATLKPAEKKIITIKGLMTGFEDETRQFTATAGVANDTNANALTSMLAKAQTDVTIEPPFFEVGVSINGSTGATAIVNTDETAITEIEFENTLDTAIYDGKILVELSGNALDEFDVKATNGFYDSSKNTITWDGVDEESLKEILPGKKSKITFSLNPKPNIGTTPEIKMKVTVQGKRVFENRVPQELVGTAERTIRIESVPTVTASIFYNSGPFTNTGPTPPVAEKVTQYTYTLMVQTGTNDITGAEMTAVLPQYVSWLDLVTDGSNVTYNAQSRTMKWTIGDMDANTEKVVSVQVSFLPSLSQVGTTPTILEAQRFKATDRFTGTVVRADHPALTTNLYAESDGDLKDGKVRAK